MILQKRKSVLIATALKGFGRMRKNIFIVHYAKNIQKPSVLIVTIKDCGFLPITTKNGTSYRSDVVEKHLTAECHIACENVERIKSLTKPDNVLTPMNVAIDKANLKQANYIGKLMIQVYIDARTLTLAAWNWPARYVASEASNVQIGSIRTEHYSRKFVASVYKPKKAP